MQLRFTYGWPCAWMDPNSTWKYLGKGKDGAPNLPVSQCSILCCDVSGGGCIDKVSVRFALNLVKTNQSPLPIMPLTAAWGQRRA